VNRINSVSLFLLALVVGCTAHEPPPPPSNANNPDEAPAPLMVTVDASGNAHLGGVTGWTVSPRDWPQLVWQWHVTSAVVGGVTGTKVSDILKVQAQIEAAGVSNTKIAEPGHSG